MTSFTTSLYLPELIKQLDNNKMLKSEQGNMKQLNNDDNEGNNEHNSKENDNKGNDKDTEDKDKDNENNEDNNNEESNNEDNDNEDNDNEDNDNENKDNKVVRIISRTFLEHLVLFFSWWACGVFKKMVYL